MQHMKESLRKYGRTGVAVYVGISLCVTSGKSPAPLSSSSLFAARRREALTMASHLDIGAGCYIAIESKVDLKKILGIKGAGQRR